MRFRGKHVEPGHRTSSARFKASARTKGGAYYLTEEYWLRQLDDRLQPARQTLEQSAIAHFIAVAVGFIALVVTLFTMWQILVDLQDRSQERQQRVEERVERAWNHLIQPIGGNVGKGGSLTTLLTNNVPLDGITLSCETVGEYEIMDKDAEKRKKCVKPPLFFDVSFPEVPRALFDAYRATNGQISISVNIPKIQGSTLRNATLRRAIISDTFLQNNLVIASDVSHSVIQYTQSGNVFQDCDLQDAHIYWSANIINICNLSGARIMVEVGKQIRPAPAIERPLSSVRLDPKEQDSNNKGNWFWGDRPPMERKFDTTASWTDSFNDKSFGSEFIVCDPAYRDDSLNARQEREIAPRFRANVEPGNRSDYAIRNGVVMLAGKPADVFCPEMTIDEAKAAYPDRYQMKKGSFLKLRVRRYTASL